jgi:hypothetical protein
MKKIALLISFLALTVQAVYADDFTSKLDLQLLSGTDIPTSKLLASQYTYGYNYGVGLGYRMSDQLSIMATVESHNTPANFSAVDYYYGYTISSNELALQVKYMIPTGPVQPYVFVGGGVALLTYNYTSGGTGYEAEKWYSSGFLAEGGVGVNLPVNDQLSVFAQTKASFVWWDKVAANSNYWDLDETLAYVPVQLGVDFHI